MNETLSAPLDLSLFDTAPAAPVAASLPVPAAPEAVPEALAPAPRLPRLVEVEKLPPDELQAAQEAAQKIDFSSSASLMAHGEGVLAGIAGASRQLLSGVRLGDAGEAGRSPPR